MLRLSPADCLIGDYFPVPKSAGTTMFWTCLDPGIITSPIIADNPASCLTKPTWSFNRARWISDSGPFVIHDFTRKPRP